MKYSLPTILIEGTNLFGNKSLNVKFSKYQKQSHQMQPSRGVPRKRCSENIQQIYRRTPMPKYDFNKYAWNFIEIAI